MAVSSIEDLQEWVWDRMGYRKYIAGREAMRDMTSVAIQEWPSSELLHMQSGSTGEIMRMDTLKASIKRHITLTHGHDSRYGFIWTLVLSAIISELVRLILSWWWNSQQNRENLIQWQKRWRNG